MGGVEETAFCKEEVCGNVGEAWGAAKEAAADGGREGSANDVAVGCTEGSDVGVLLDKDGNAPGNGGVEEGKGNPELWVFTETFFKPLEASCPDWKEPAVLAPSGASANAGHGSPRKLSWASSALPKYELALSRGCGCECVGAAVWTKGVWLKFEDGNDDKKGSPESDLK